MKGALMPAVVFLMSLGVISTSHAAADPPALTPSKNVAPVTGAAPAQAPADLVEHLRGSGPKVR